jgi:hypothetical protein
VGAQNLGTLSRAACGRVQASGNFREGVHASVNGSVRASGNFLACWKVPGDRMNQPIGY